MEKLRLTLVPRATKITVKLSYAPRSIPLYRNVTPICAARQKWQRVLSALASLSDFELAESLPELIVQLCADKAGFKNTQHYASFSIALHLMAKNLGMDLRKFC